MKYDFDKFNNRTHSYSIKWHLKSDINPLIGEDIPPLSTAEMEFDNAPEIINGLIKFLEGYRFLGYCYPTENYLQSVVNWHKKQHNIDLVQEWIIPTPGIICALGMGVQLLSEENDGVIIFNPVYSPFNKVVTESGRKVVNVALIEENGDYQIDWDLFKQEATNPNNKVLLFCNPHNPIGRTWTHEELEKILKICRENEIAIISDDIWQDWGYQKDRHRSFLHHSTNNDEIMVCTSPSKTFNLGGMKVSNIIIPNVELRKKFARLQSRNQYFVNILGLEATRLAYNEAEDWFNQAKGYIENNLIYAVDRINNIEGLKTKYPDFGYCLWVDFRNLCLSNEQLDNLLIQEAQIIGASGHTYSNEGAGFVRFNLAITRNRLKIVLDNLEKVVTGHLITNYTKNKSSNL